MEWTFSSQQQVECKLEISVHKYINQLIQFALQISNQAHLSRLYRHSECTEWCGTFTQFQASIFALYAYDAVYQYLSTVDRVVQEQRDHRDGQLIFDMSTKMPFWKGNVFTHKNVFHKTRMVEPSWVMANLLQWKSDMLQSVQLLGSIFMPLLPIAIF